MKIKEILSKCHKVLDGKDKRKIIIIALVVLLFSTLFATVINLSLENRQLRRVVNLQRQSNGRMMDGRAKNAYKASVDQNFENRGVWPVAGGATFDSGQNQKSKLILVLVLKTGLLLVLFIFLVIMLKRNFGDLREARNKKNKHIPSRPVKLQVKTRPRAVKRETRTRRKI